MRKLFCLFTLLLSFASAIAQTYTISQSTGVLNNGTSKSSVWTSNEVLDVTLKITATDSNGKVVNTISVLNSGYKFYAVGLFPGTENISSSPTTYTLSVEDEDYIITGYKMTYYPSADGKVTLRNEYGYNETPASSKIDYVMETKGLNTRSTTFTIEASNANYAVCMLEFTVTLQKAGGEGGEEPGGGGEEVVVDYTPNHTGAKSNTNRKIGSFTVNGDTYTLTGTEQTQKYVDKTSKTFTVAAGAEVALEMTQADGSWMNAFVYVDADKNGFTAGVTNNYVPTGDLVSYSFYNNGASSDERGWNSKGDIIEGNNRSTLALPSFIAPSTPGTYRMRAKYDWCNIDPAGSTDRYFKNDFAGHGAAIIDFTLVVEAKEPEAPSFSYESIDKPTFAKGGNTTKVAMIDFNGQNLSGFTYTQGTTKHFNMPQVEAGKTYSLNLTYEMDWGDLAIFQIDKNNIEKKYGYYTCVWAANGDPFTILVNNTDNQSIMCKELGISSLTELEATSTSEHTYLTIPYQITIDENLEPGDITVIRVMVGKSDNGAYNAKNITEGGCLDLVFTVKEPEVVPAVLSAGKYFRFKSSNEYLAVEGTGDDKLGTSKSADANSIFYIVEGEGENQFYIVSYAKGHYLKTAYETGVGESYKGQWEIKGSNGVYSMKYSTSYMCIGATGGGIYDTNDASGSAWTIEEVTELPVTVTSAGWGTFYAPVEVTIPNGVKAYYLTADGVHNGYIKMTELTNKIIPTETAVILEGEGDHNFKITNNGYTTVVDNLFDGTVAATYITDDAYVLTLKNGEVCLGGVLLNQLNGTAFLNNSHKAYLPASALPNPSGVSFYSILWGNEEEENTTAIENVEIVNENVIYDLSGRRVSEITEKGVYIVGGRKVLVK